MESYNFSTIHDYSCGLWFSDNFEMEDDEITLKGFLDLNMMEAQDADGDPNDLWLTLENMGYNKALELDQVNYYYLQQLTMSVLRITLYFALSLKLLYATLLTNQIQNENQPCCRGQLYLAKI